jgi:hypothetical protein
MNLQGLLLIALGLGLLWSASAYAEDSAAVAEFQYQQLTRAGRPRWLKSLLAPPRMNRSPRLLIRSNQAVALLVIVAGVLNLVGVWRV